MTTYPLLPQTRQHPLQSVPGRLAVSLALILALIATALISPASAQVNDTPPSNRANHFVTDNGDGLSRTGRIARHAGCSAGGDGLSAWRQDRGHVRPSQTPHLLSNPYHRTGLAMTENGGVPDDYTGHVPVYSEGNWWPNVGPQQPSPQSLNGTYNRDLVHDTGLFFQDGKVVPTSEALFVPGLSRLTARNETNCSFYITTGSFPGAEQPGQALTYMGPGSSVTVPLAPEGWWPAASTPETYSSVAGLNSLHIPGWHHSSWSPRMYSGGDQSRDFGTPGFAYNLDPSPSNGAVYTNLRTAEGYDPAVSGDPGYGIALYVNGELASVVDMVKTSDTHADATLVAKSRYNPQNFQQGAVTVAGAVVDIAASESGEYRYLTHEAAQALISEYRNRDGYSVVTQGYDSNPSANVGGEYLPSPLNPGVFDQGDGSNDSNNDDDSVNNDNDNNAGPSARIEAESGQVLGGASVYQDDAASGQQAVGNTDGVGRGVQFSNIPAGTSLTVGYSSALSGSISYFVNGQDRGDINFSSTGAWTGSYQQVSIEGSFNAGDSLEIRSDGGDTAMNIDWIQLAGAGGAAADNQRVEAEDATLSGGAVVLDDPSASGDQAVGSPDSGVFAAGADMNLNDNDVASKHQAKSKAAMYRSKQVFASFEETVSFEMPRADAINLRYTSETGGTASYSINGQYRGTVSLQPTGGWFGDYQQTTLFVASSPGDVIDFQLRNPNGGVNLDWVEFVNFAGWSGGSDWFGGDVSGGNEFGGGLFGNAAAFDCNVSDGNLNWTDHDAVRRRRSSRRRPVPDPLRRHPPPDLQRRQQRRTLR